MDIFLLLVAIAAGLLFALVAPFFAYALLVQLREYVEYKSEFVEACVFALIMYLGSRWVMMSKDWHNFGVGLVQCVGMVVIACYFWYRDRKLESHEPRMWAGGSVLFCILRFFSLTH